MAHLNQVRQTHSIHTGWTREPLMTTRKTAYSMIADRNESCTRAIVEQLIAPMFPNKDYWGGTYIWEPSSNEDMVLTVFEGSKLPCKTTGRSSPILGLFVFTREGLAEALMACGHKNPEEWG